MTTRLATAHDDLMWVTCACHTRDHAVAAAALAARHRADAEIRALCGERFWPAALVADPGPRCPRCLDHVRDQGIARRSRHREGVLGRWLTQVLGRSDRTVAGAEHGRNGVRQP